MGDKPRMNHVMSAMVAQMALCNWLFCDVPDRVPDDEILSLGEPWQGFDNELGISLKLSKPYIDLSMVRSALRVDEIYRSVWFSAFLEAFGDEVISNGPVSLPVDEALYPESPVGFGYWAFMAVVMVLTLNRLSELAKAGQSMQEIHIGDMLRKTATAILVSRFGIEPPEDLKGFRLLIPAELRFVFGAKGKR